MRRGKQQQQWRCKGNSVTFTSSPGNDALASGIRLEGMWVERLSRYTQRQKYGGRWIFFFFFFFGESVGISAYADFVV